MKGFKGRREEEEEILVILHSGKVGCVMKRGENI